MKRKEKYQNSRTHEIKEFDAEIDQNGLCPMYQFEDGNEWKAVSKWSLNLVNSQYFFESAHNNTVKFTKPPLDGSDFSYGVT